MNNAIRACASATLLLALILSKPALSAQDIVYSARYYYCPPRARVTSHFHIYRIDPNGRHKIQLTFGTADDVDPVWSPNGRYIVFCRFTDGFSIDPLIVIDPHGHRIAKIEDDGYQFESWRADSRTIILTSETTAPKNMVDQLLVDVHGRIVAKRRVPDPHSYVPPHGSHSDIRPITEKDGTPTGRYTFKNFDSKGRITYHKVLTEPTKYKSDDYDSDLYGDDFIGFEPWPEHEGAYVARKRWAQTAYGLFYINPAQSVIRIIGITDVFVWSPDHNVLCSIPGRGCTNYRRRPDGTWLVVWVDPLQIIDIKKGATRTIQGGLVNVENLDWRRRPYSRR